MSVNLTLSDADVDTLATLIAAKVAQKIGGSPPSAVQLWELIYREDWGKYPLGVDFPNDTVDWSAAFDPWVSGLGADGNLLTDHASAKVIQKPDGSRRLLLGIWNTLWKDIGARLFICDHKQWKWWGNHFVEGQTGRITAPVTYLNPVTLAGGVGAYCQVFAEFKTLERDAAGKYLPTAVQILLKQEADGFYFYLNLGGTIFAPQSREPLQFGVPLLHELTLDFSIQKTAQVTFRCGKTVVQGTGRTLNPTNGQVGGGLLVYSNEIKDTEKFSAEVGTVTIERLIRP